MHYRRLATGPIWNRSRTGRCLQSSPALVATSDCSTVDTLVDPRHLLSCLEGLRTSRKEDLILCFHLIDWYRDKVIFRWWLELIITCFTSYPRLRLLDEWTHTFEEPLHVKATLSTLGSRTLGFEQIWTTKRCHVLYGKTLRPYKGAPHACAFLLITDLDGKMYSRKTYAPT